MGQLTDNWTISVSQHTDANHCSGIKTWNIKNTKKPRTETPKKTKPKLDCL